MLRVPHISADETLSTALHLELHQAWQGELDPGFQVGEVRVGWDHDSLKVQAILQDQDIFNAETRFNEPAFYHGDVFEIFLQPPEGEAYYEFHIGPDNQLYQLRIPSTEQFSAARSQGIPENWHIEKDKIISSVKKNATSWTVTAKIPIFLLGRPEIHHKEVWKMSFCRYDRNRSSDKYVISSTSPIMKPDFHRKSEWHDFLMV